MKTSAPQAVYRLDYRPPDYYIDSVELRFHLEEQHTDVCSRLKIRRNTAREPNGLLVLDGCELELRGLKVDGKPWRDFEQDEQSLTLRNIPERCELEVLTRIFPQANTSLEGLYCSNGTFCTQCEAEGFRKITYFLDRPDVMAAYTTTLVADRERYPVLLSNGNLIDQGSDGARHWATWQDPFAKPSYLFALVAGRLECVSDTFTTRSGRVVALQIYVEPGNQDQCGHAMESLKKAMVWDEKVYGLEYDLDIFMIVAVADFNMGAMENKGLNIFNTKFVLAKPETATDADYQGVEGVIAHEYFHNWTGNRITCRDWFQLSLKEGLTVFRDQEFSADMGSRGVKRIDDVRILRSVQFPQDSGPMAHPVRPDSYIEINNFYTVTVYNKGAEVVRMMHTLLGADGFRRGMDLYVERHDGAAVTCDDFVDCMETANSVDLQQFRRWYSQAGTPRLRVSGNYDPSTRKFTLQVAQDCPATPGQGQKDAFHIPFSLGLLGRDGTSLALQLDGENSASDTPTRVLELKDREHTFTFVNIDQPPIPSLLRGFSAPVKLDYDYSDADLMFLLAHDCDEFNRWEAAQQLALRTILGLVKTAPARDRWRLEGAVCDAFARALADPQADPALLAQVLTLPSENDLAEQMQVADVENIFAARQFMRRKLAEAMREPLTITYAKLNSSQTYRIDAAAMGRRSLKNRCLDYLSELPDDGLRALALAQFEQADNMTDQLAALVCLSNRDTPERDAALQAFYQRWRDEALVVDKWFALQATSRLPDALKQVETLMRHEAFSLKNPNKVRALVGAFCQNNPINFHAADGSGYRFLGDQVAALNSLNPQVAARLLGALTRWRKYDGNRQELMRAQLKRILEIAGLSADVFEIAAKSLDG